MPFLIMIIGAILIVTALAGTNAQLAAELENDIPPFFKWGAALAAVAALGFIPGLRTPSRLLLALIVLVIVVKYYPQIFGSIKSFTSTPAQASTGNAGAAAYASSVAQAQAATQPITDIFAQFGQ